MPDLTVLVLASERAEAILELYRETRAIFQSTGMAVEYVFALEPWFASLAEDIRRTKAPEDQLEILVSAHRMGETGLVRMALPHCRAPRLLILPAYQRVAPESLPILLRALDQADLVVARRWPRNDSFINRLQSRVFHRVTGWVTGIRLRDIGSGVRAIRREVLEEVPLYGDLYRFLPVLAARDGFRVSEEDSAQHPADARTRVYRPAVYLRRALDLLGLYFLVRFTEKPLRFFGLIGAILGVVGGLVLLIVLLQKIGGQGVADRPLLLLGVLLFVLGVQAVALGLIGEIIVHIHAARYRRYRVARSDGQ
jgi:hypothetical protein